MTVVAKTTGVIYFKISSELSKTVVKSKATIFNTEKIKPRAMPRIIKGINVNGNKNDVHVKETPKYSNTKIESSIGMAKFTVAIIIFSITIIK